jgi:hypothetical protein
VLLLIDCNMLCRWPECVSTKGIGPRCFVIVAVLFPTAVCTGVVGTNRVVAMRVAVPAHVTWFLILGASAVAIATACVGIDVLAVLLFAIWVMAAISFLISDSIDAILSVACVFAASSLLAPLLAISWIHSHSLLP